MVTDNVDLDIDGISGDGERAIAGAYRRKALTGWIRHSWASAPP